MSGADAKKSRAKKIAGIASVVLWVLSFALSFVIKAGQPLTFIPDLLLLLGFFPLLILWQKGWLTFLFGLCNTFIGFFLLLLQYLEPGNFTAQMQPMREHLVSMHSCWTWMILGIVAFVWGAVATVIDIVKWFAARRKK